MHGQAWPARTHVGKTWFETCASTEPVRLFSEKEIEMSFHLDLLAAERASLTPKRVLELIVEGKDGDICGQLPDHIRGSFNAIREKIGTRYLALLMAASIEFNKHREKLRDSRKAFAMEIVDQPGAVKALLFAMASEKTPEQIKSMAYSLIGKEL